MQHKPQKVALVIGGTNEHRSVGLDSKNLILPILENLKYDTSFVDFDPRCFIDDMRRIEPDVVYNKLDGLYGQNGAVQGVLDLMKIPYTHSSLLSSSLAGNKYMAKKVFKGLNIAHPSGRIISKTTKNKEDALLDYGIRKPYVIKPICGGCSIGIVLVENGNYTIEDYSFTESSSVLVEEYIAGREFTVAIYNNRSIGMAEIFVQNKMFDTNEKYGSDTTDKYSYSPELANSQKEEITKTAENAHRAMGCDGITRVDIKMKDDKAYVLEVNINPGFTSHSLFPKIALKNGKSIEEIVNNMIVNAKYSAFV